MKTTIGDRLRTARDNKEMDQASLAEKAGVVTRTLQRWEKGEQIPREALRSFSANGCASSSRR